MLLAGVAKTTKPLEVKGSATKLPSGLVNRNLKWYSELKIHFKVN